MKTYFTIIDRKNSKEETCYLGTENGNITTLLENAMIFKTEEDAENYIEEFKLSDWAEVNEEEYFFKLEGTHLTKLPSGHGHWTVKGESNGFSTTITTNDSQLIDDAFNSEEGDTSYYESVEEARGAVIDLLNN